MGQKTNPSKLPENVHLLELIKCRCFFGLDIDQSLLDNIKVNKEDFDLLLDVIDLIGYNENNIKIITDNLPKEYDLSELPTELLNKILTLAESPNIAAAYDDGSIKIWNILTGDLINTINDRPDPGTICGAPTNTCISFRNDILDPCIASISFNNKIKIWNVNMGDL